jgi:hypothetical protein
VAVIDTATADGFDGWYLAGAAGAKLTAGSYDGFSVSAISDDGAALTLGGLNAADVRIEARFTPKTHTLRYIAKSGRGVITPLRGVTGEYLGDTLVVRAERGAVVSVKASPNIGCKFLEWMDIMSGEKLKDTTRTDTALSDITFNAYFTADVVTLTYTAGLNGRLRVNNATTVSTNTPYTVNPPPPYGTGGPLVAAIPNEGYRFVTWDDGVTDSARTDSVATENVNATAIFEKTPVAVMSPDRVIPGKQLNNETVLIQPIKSTTGGFTAGPNPVSKHGGGVNFYWHGTKIADGTLLIFDAVGGLVNKILINGNDKPQIASWDLTDANGKPAGAGTYLVMGTLLTKSGKPEKVTLILTLI